MSHPLTKSMVLARSSQEEIPRTQSNLNRWRLKPTSIQYRLKKVVHNNRQIYMTSQWMWLAVCHQVWQNYRQTWAQIKTLNRPWRLSRLLPLALINHPWRARHSSCRVSIDLASRSNRLEIHRAPSNYLWLTAHLEVSNPLAKGIKRRIVHKS